MKRNIEHTVLAASACTVLLAGCATDAPPPPAPPEPPAAVAPAVPGEDNTADANDNADAAAAGAGGDEDGEQAVRICVDPNSGERKEDSECEALGEQADAEVVTDAAGETTVVHNHYGGSPLTPLLWYYIGRSSAGGAGPIIPAVGSSVAGSGASPEKPKHGTIAKNPPRDARAFSESYRSSKDVAPAATANTNSTRGGQNRSGAGAGAGTANGSGSGNNSKSGNTGNTGNSGNTGNTGNTGEGHQNNSGSKGDTGHKSKSGNKSGGFGGSKSSGGSHGG